MIISVELSHKMVIAELHHARHKSLGIIKETGYAAKTGYLTVKSLKPENCIKKKNSQS